MWLRIILFLLFLPILSLGLWLISDHYQNRYTYQDAPALPWMHQQIQHDLKHFQTIPPSSWALAKQLIDEGTLKHVFLVNISDHGVSYYPQLRNKRALIIVAHLNRMQRSGALLPNVQFLLGAEDKWDRLAAVPEALRTLLPPIFVFASNQLSPHRHHYILFPDDHTLGNHALGYRKGWGRVYREMLAKREQYSWEARIPKLIWRGLPNDVSVASQLPSPRQKLVELGEEYPVLLDVAFNQMPFAQDFVVKTLRPLFQAFSIPPYYSYERQMHYRYTIVIDGKTCTYPGFLWRLASGSLVFKQDSQDIQWFYGVLKPFIHYVPVEHNLSDLIDKVSAFMANEQEARKIIKAAKTIIAEALQPAHFDRYIIELLQAYKQQVFP